MDKIIYGLCALTALLCAALLLRGYVHARARSLLWSGLCFAGLAVNNVLLILDRLVFTEIDMSLWRLSITLIATLLLVVGLLMDHQP